MLFWYLIREPTKVHAEVILLPVHLTNRLWRDIRNGDQKKREDKFSEKLAM